MSQTIDTATVRSQVAGGPMPLLVDVRTPAEFESAHIPGAINLPLAALEWHTERVSRDATEQMILVCQSGPRAKRAQARLAAAGLTDTVVLDGGMNTWEDENGSVVRGPEHWALERQVRLLAGSIVLVAALASLWWTPAVFVAAFVGAGLAFAGLTDTCGMALLLAKLPHNRPTTKVDVEASLARISRAGNRV